MTCVVAYKTKSKIGIASDKCASNGYTFSKYNQPKIFRNGGFIIGYTTSFRLGQLLEYRWIPPQRGEDQTENNYIFVSVIESIKDMLVVDGFSTNGVGGNFIIIYNKRIFEVQDDYSLLEVKDYCAVGCGTDEAETTLYILEQIENNLSIKDKLRLAIKAAANRKVGVLEDCDVIIESL